MKKTVNIALLATLMLSAACTRDISVVRVAERSVAFELSMPRGEWVETRASDADNLEEELHIENLSFFLVQSGSDTVMYKYVQQPFASIDNTTIQNRKRAVLSLVQGTLPPMDVHVVANCSDLAALGAVQTVSDIQKLQAPTATTAVGLTTADGLPMYGVVTGANLNTSTATTPVQISLTRACAKLRVTLTFTDPTWVGTNNSFVLENAPPYTCYVPGQTPTFTAAQLINYPQTDFEVVSATQFRSIVYAYEAVKPPQLHLYTTVNGVNKNYVASNQFPLLARNYLYDIELQVLKPLPTRSSDGGMEMTVRVAEW